MRAVLGVTWQTCVIVRGVIDGPRPRCARNLSLAVAGGAGRDVGLVGRDRMIVFLTGLDGICRDAPHGGLKGRRRFFSARSFSVAAGVLRARSMGVAALYVVRCGDALSPRFPPCIRAHRSTSLRKARRDEGTQARREGERRRSRVGRAGGPIRDLGFENEPSGAGRRGGCLVGGASLGKWEESTVNSQNVNSQNRGAYYDIVVLVDPKYLSLTWNEVISGGGEFREAANWGGGCPSRRGRAAGWGGRAAGKESSRGLVWDDIDSKHNIIAGGRTLRRRRKCTEQQAYG